MSKNGPYTVDTRKRVSTCRGFVYVAKSIQTIYDESRGIYGAPKIHKIISGKFDVSLKKVQKLMKELGLRYIITKKFKHHTTKLGIVEKDNVLDRYFSTTTINEKEVGDIEYIEGGHNRKRIHGSIGFLSQNEYEKICREKQGWRYEIIA